MAKPQQNPSLYQDLQTSCFIRLLKLSPSSSSGPSEVKGELKTFCLTDQDCPRFTTVSYTWGDASAYSDETIKLNNHETKVLQSVLPLLHMICSGSCVDFDLEKDWFWIDSICINQHDFSERANQVKLMGQIYRQANATIVWLAEGNADTDQAVEFLTDLARRRRLFRREVDKQGKHTPPDLVDHPGWKFLERLLSLPWWRRVWTLQEYILARNLKFYCGTRSITRADFRKGLHVVELCSPKDDYIKSRVWQTAWNRRRLAQWYEHEDRKDSMSLLSLLAFCGDYQATDPRDRVWAVYGLACEDDRQMVGQPTYICDVKTLYTSLVTAYVDKYKSLDIICYSQIFRSHDPEWPSWLPDWRTELQPLVVPLMVSQSANETLANFRSNMGARRRAEMAAREKVLFKAAGDQPPTPQIWDTPGCLTCQGVFIDYIDGLGGIRSGDTVRGIEPTSPSNTKTADPQERRSLREEVVRSLVLDRLDQYMEFPAPVRHYGKELQELAAACVGQGQDDGSAPRWFRKWWHINSEFRIRGSTIRDICHTEDDDDYWNACNTEEPEPRNSKSFLLRMRGVKKAKLRRIAVTDEGHVGMAPKGAQKGDMVCVLFGCSVPVVLRKRGHCESAEPFYELIGECYLDGFMNGEALNLSRETQNFKIQ